MTTFVHVDYSPEHLGVRRVQRAVAYVRGIFHGWAEASRHEAEAGQTRNATLRDARQMASLSRSMNGIAVEDMRRYD